MSFFIISILVQNHSKYMGVHLKPLLIRTITFIRGATMYNHMGPGKNMNVVSYSVG